MNKPLKDYSAVTQENQTIGKDNRIIGLQDSIVMITSKVNKRHSLFSDASTFIVDWQLPELEKKNTRESLFKSELI
jgi:hypothetical protein